MKQTVYVVKDSFGCIRRYAEHGKAREYKILGTEELDIQPLPEKVEPDKAKVKATLWRGKSSNHAYVTTRERADLMDCERVGMIEVQPLPAEKRWVTKESESFGMIGVEPGTVIYSVDFPSRCRNIKFTYEIEEATPDLVSAIESIKEGV
jgi:hypothetical protein